MRIDLKTLTLLKEQKRLEDDWAANNKEPKYTAIVLDIASASKAFEKVKTILTRVRGMLEVPLVYVIRHQLFPEEEHDDPAFKDDDDKKPQYTSHDHEMITRCPIVMTTAILSLLMATLKLMDLLSQPFSLTRRRFGLFSTRYS